MKTKRRRTRFTSESTIRVDDRKTAVEWHVLPRLDQVRRDNGSAILTVCRQLANAGHDCERIALVADSGLPHDLDCLAIVSYRKYMEWRLVSLFGMLSLFCTGHGFTDGFRIDRPHTEGVPQRLILHNRPWAGSYISRNFREAQSVLYLHNKVMMGAPPYLMRRAISKYDVVVTVSRFLREDLIDRARIKDEKTKAKIRVVRSGVAAAQFDLPHAPEFDLVYVGRVIPEKGLHILLQSLETGQLHNRKVLVVGGSGFQHRGVTSYEQDCVDYARSRSLDVTFTGLMPPSRIPPAMSGGRVVVVPSVWDEPLGLVVLEAMASPAAVVASNVGGIKEMAPRGTQDGVIFFERGSVVGLAQELRRLLLNDDLIDTLARRGQKLARSCTWAQARTDLTEVLLEALARQNGTSRVYVRGMSRREIWTAARNGLRRRRGGEE